MHVTSQPNSTVRFDDGPSTAEPAFPWADDAGRQLRQLCEAEEQLSDALAHARASVRCYEQALALLADIRQCFIPAHGRGDVRGHAAAGVAAGRNGSSESDAGCLRWEQQLVHPLTARESEVLEHIAAGLSNREIAVALFLSPRTVERHIANIYLKIDVHSKTEATAFAQCRRLV